MRYLPIHFDTHGKTILIAGGQGAAEAKLRTLLKTDATLIVMTPDPSPEILRWEEQGQLQIERRIITESDLDSAVLVYAATEDEPFDAEIAGWASARGIPVNAADQKDACSFITPALVDRSPVIVSLGTEGTSPGLARALKADLEARLPKTLGKLAHKVLELRNTLKRQMPEISDRQAVWAKVFGGALEDKLALDEATIQSRYDAVLSGTSTEKGHVWIVGAGPGDPGLLTREAQRVLHAADTIIYDRLVSQEVLDLGRREAEYIYVGKDPNGHSTRQEAINALMVEHAQKGARVVRLKSGDPLVFGRADEEFDALDASNIPFTIIPGITAATAAASQIKSSLTTRGENTAVQLVTGHGEDGFTELNWAALAEPNSKACVYMGVKAARFIQGRLLLHGASKDLPVTVVENSSRTNSQVLSTTLGQLPQAMALSNIRGPAILMLGFAPRIVSKGRAHEVASAQDRAKA
jgi:uroporphyrin-III C-methyltransferase/precorrin-2 dehydrogenase/sirohydrochlorin ferrochelatase